MRNIGEHVAKCTPDECQYHKLTESVVGDMKLAVDKLAEGQVQMRETLVQLTEAFKQMDRLERRLDKVEEEQKQENKDQGKSIRDLEKGYWKAAGALGILAILSQLIIKVFTGI